MEVCILHLLLVEVEWVLIPRLFFSHEIWKVIDVNLVSDMIPWYASMYCFSFGIWFLCYGTLCCSLSSKMWCVLDPPKVVPFWRILHDSATFLRSPSNQDLSSFEMKFYFYLFMLLVVSRFEFSININIDRLFFLHI